MKYIYMPQNNCDTGEIQRKGNNLLEKELINLGIHMPELMAIPRNQDDKADIGIDYECEIIRRKDDDSMVIFKIQNKGSSNELTPLKKTSNKGLISFQISQKHANYYLNQIKFPLIITVCDLVHEKVYWHPIQLDEDLEKRLEERKSQKSIQIYFDPENYISKSTARKFYRDVIKSEKKQEYKINKLKSRNPLMSEDTILSGEKPDSHWIEYLYQMLSQPDINIIPLKILFQYHPFKISEDFTPYQRRNTLIIDNEDLYFYFNSIDIVDGQINSIDSGFLKDKEGVYEKSKHILWQLNKHQIFELSLRQTRKSKNIRLKDSDETSKLDFYYTSLGFEGLINILSSEDDSYDSLEMGFRHYQLGNFLLAAKSFVNAARTAENEDRKITQFIAEYNLKKIYPLFRIVYAKDKSFEEVSSAVRNIDLDSHKYLAENEIDRKIISTIDDYDFYVKALEEIGKYFSKIRDQYVRQLSGGWSSNGSTALMIDSYQRFDQFFSKNFIVFEHFTEHQDLFRNFLEGLFMSHAMEDNQGGKLKYFDDYLMSKIVQHGKAEDIMEFFNRYKLSSIKYKSSNRGSGFLLMSHNFLIHFENLKHFSENYFGKEILLFQQKFNQIFQNLVLLFSISDIGREGAIRFSKELLTFLKDAPFYQFFPVKKFIVKFFQRKGEYINKEVLEEYLFLFLQYEKFRDDTLISSVVHTIKDDFKRMDLGSERWELIIKAAEKMIKSPQAERPLFLLVLHSYVLSEYQDKIKGWVESNLSNSFNKDLYSYAVLYGVISAEFENPFFGKYLDAIKNRPEQQSFALLTGKEEIMEYDVNTFLNVCYHAKIDLSKEEFDEFRDINPYYRWLFDLENFDYEIFDPLWLVEYRSDFFYDEFKKYPSIKKKALEYLRTNSNPQLERIILKICE